MRTQLSLPEIQMAEANPVGGSCWGNKQGFPVSTLCRRLRLEQGSTEVRSVVKVELMHEALVIAWEEELLA
jgi:hypothetical protein